MTRRWKPGDVIELILPMPVRRIVANDQVAADRDRVALQRGPIVYAAEWPDNPNGKVRNIVLPDTATLGSEFRADLLNGVQVVTATGVGLAMNRDGRSGESRAAVHGHSVLDMGESRPRRNGGVARAHRSRRPADTIPDSRNDSVVTTSGRKDTRGINDGEEPASSSDAASYFDWWPAKGTTEWIEYAFAKPATVSEVQLYWFDDTGRGEVRVPKTWQILYKDGNAWKPVAAVDEYGVAKDAFNTLRFAPVTTSGLRLEVTMQPQWSAGVQEWKVK